MGTSDKLNRQILPAEGRDCGKIRNSPPSQRPGAALCQHNDFDIH
jgi:hypothetical protein